MNDKNTHEIIFNNQELQLTSRSIKSISHPLRLKILCLLNQDERCVQDIVEYVGTSQSNVSQHLSILRDKNILKSRKEANRIFYQIKDKRTVTLIKLLRESFCT